ncbi:YceI-like domain-containing protein [Tenacibaculum adriaticum]|uniref:YceI-like domain-containing protein n=1 Tax=Tenacibaculum adriaticum TaxID=413713 RepID=A0A5S5DUK9_9FLAO|nr:YceI family protein [Tenacibaculum adriaticum]TYP99495.1 YceI-like domain-containing protein [Tenacibaculum adriaticum]
MKKLILSLVVFASVLTACKSEKKEKVEVKEEVVVEETVAAEEVALDNVNVETSVLTWKGTKPTGAHEGTVALKSGSLVVEEGTVKSGEFVVDLNTIKCTDLGDSEYGQKLIGHLKNADFFDVEKYPTSKFVITSVENKDDKLAVTGNLTIKDVTKSITIPATVSEENGVVTFKSDKFNIDRADFNVKYASKKFFDNLKDKFVDDLVELSFEVKATK